MGLGKKKMLSQGAAGGVVGTDNFSVITYTGTAGVQSTNSLSSQAGTVDFQPDFVWIKARNSTTAHELHDSVRGEPSRLWGNESYAASTALNGFVAITSNGFSLDSVGNGGNVNRSAINHVAWCWKAGGAASSNGSGSITSQVSANQAAGFSIVKGSLPTNGASNGATFGHGLSQTPELIISKATSITLDWYAFSQYGGSLLGTNNVLKLNTTDGATSDSFFDITSTTFKFGSTNTAHDFVAYCFTSISGYQKVGSYTGSGTSLNVINVGFAPRTVIFKCRDTAGTGWRIFDTTRGTDKSITINSAIAEYDDINNYVDFTSTGFEFNRNYTQQNGDINGSGRNYIYLAIA